MRRGFRGVAAGIALLLTAGAAVVAWALAPVDASDARAIAAPSVGPTHGSQTSPSSRPIQNCAGHPPADA